MEATFCKGEYVRYAFNGVCLIEDIRQDSSGSRGSEREFYILKPVSSPGSTIFVPMDNDLLRSRMERLPTPEEVDALILSSRDQDLDWIDNRKDRASRFQTIVKDCKLQELLRLAGCLFHKQEELNARGKKLSASDENILRRAESLLENELAFLLSLPLDQVRPYIKNKLAGSA